MNIVVKLLYNNTSSGRLFIDGKYFCDVLTTSPRKLPLGVYSLAINQVSPKFKSRSWAKVLNGCVPWIVGNGVDSRRFLIHVGNFPSDSSGCLLIGTFSSSDFLSLSNSVSTYVKFAKLLSSASSRGESLVLIVES